MTLLTALDTLDMLVVQEESSGITKKVLVSDFVKIIMPVGSIILHPAPSPPTNWLICDGSAVSRTTYSALYTMIATTYGAGDGSSTFNLPNFTNRVPVGLGNSSSFNSLGKKVGAETHTLSQGEMPSHIHSAWTDAQGNHNHNMGGAANWGSFGAWGLHESSGSSSNGVLYTNTTGAHGHNVGIGATGGSGAHNNIQPSIVINFIIKAL